jgi:putative transposase
VIRDEPRRRRSTNRAEEYDYSTPGWYFVTVCTHELRHLFGEVVEGQMVLNDFGRIVAEEWNRIAITRPNIELDTFIVMPNHFHGIIVIRDQPPLVRATPCVALGSVGPACQIQVPCDETAGADAPRATHGVARTNSWKLSSDSVGAIVGQIKSASSRRVNRLRNTPGERIWHRNYYDHIIRDERDLDRVREYIAGNPGNWAFDRANRKEAIIP